MFQSGEAVREETNSIGIPEIERVVRISNGWRILILSDSDETATKNGRLAESLRCAELCADSSTSEISSRCAILVHSLSMYSSRVIVMIYSTSLLLGMRHSGNFLGLTRSS